MKTVLIVEDNELNMKLFNDLLEAHGYATLKTSDGIEAIELARTHHPDLILISAGFDAHVRDPMASLRLVDTDFAWITRRLMETADRVCGGRVVSLLEGGYDLEALASSASAHVSALMHG